MAMLKHARRRLGELGGGENIVWYVVQPWICLTNASFGNVICGLATHHMDVKKLLSEAYRVSREGGILSIADAGGALFGSFRG